MIWGWYVKSSLFVYFDPFLFRKAFNCWKAIKLLSSTPNNFSRVIFLKILKKMTEVSRNPEVISALRKTGPFRHMNKNFIFSFDYVLALFFIRVEHNYGGGVWHILLILFIVPTKNAFWSAAVVSGIAVSCFPLARIRNVRDTRESLTRLFKIFMNVWTNQQTLQFARHNIIKCAK